MGWQWIRKKRRQALWLTVFVVICITGLFYWLAGIARQDTDHFVVIRKKLQVKNLPPEFEGYRILHITDIHGKQFGSHQSEIITTLSRESIDIVCLTGDYVFKQNRQEPQGVDATADLITGLKQTHSDCPVFFILGNWDMLHKNIIINELTLAGAVFPKTPRSITRGKSKILIGPATLSIPQAKNNPIPNRQFYIGLIHYPWDSNYVKKAGNKPRIKGKYLLRQNGKNPKAFVRADLFLAGHTHGGQIRLPLMEKIVPMIYTKGEYRRGDSVLYVSGGIGTGNISLLRYRLFNPAEISILELHRDNTKKPL